MNGYDSMSRDRAGVALGWAFTRTCQYSSSGRRCNNINSSLVLAAGSSDRFHREMKLKGLVCEFLEKNDSLLSTAALSAFEQLQKNKTNYILFC